MTTTKKRKPKANGNFTAYTDHDRVKKLTTEATILAEYRRLKLTPVWVHDLLLSPALTETLRMELVDVEDAPVTEPQDAPGHPVGQQGGGDA
jgi:hypothetical protein